MGAYVILKHDHDFNTEGLGFKELIWCDQGVASLRCLSWNTSLITTYSELDFVSISLHPTLNTVSVFLCIPLLILYQYFSLLHSLYCIIIAINPTLYIVLAFSISHSLYWINIPLYMTLNTVSAFLYISIFILYELCFL